MHKCEKNIAYSNMCDPCSIYIVKRRNNEYTYKFDRIIILQCKIIKEDNTQLKRITYKYMKVVDKIDKQ